MPYNQFGVEVNCLRSVAARYVKFGIPDMNALAEEMKIKGHLAAGIGVSTGFQSVMCKRNLGNPGPFWDQEK